MGNAYNVMAATCPSRTVLHRIGARWTVFIVNALDNGPKRFTELKAHIRGITPKALTETLRAMEYDGLISRKEIPAHPPHVEYALTDLGRSLLAPCVPSGNGPRATSPTLNAPAHKPMRNGDPARRWVRLAVPHGSRRSGRSVIASSSGSS